MTTVTIAGLARAAGVSVETVRFYQRRGLLRTPRAGKGLSRGVRRYAQDDIGRLRFIRAAQAAGFTLAEIGELLKLDAGNDHARARAMAQTRIAALDRKIAELQHSRDALARLARKCHANASEPCAIISAFG